MSALWQQVWDTVREEFSDLPDPARHANPLEQGRSCDGTAVGPYFLGHSFPTDVLLFRLPDTRFQPWASTRSEARLIDKTPQMGEKRFDDAPQVMPRRRPKGG
jgi:hypothetical protein